MKKARELYEYVLTMEYVKQNKELFAMTNINTGMSYQFDVENKVENAKKAIAYYEIGISLYESIEADSFKYEISNAKLDIASAYKTIYRFSKNDDCFNKSNDKINEIINKEKYNPNNSLLLRTYLLQLNLYMH